MHATLDNGVEVGAVSRMCTRRTNAPGAYLRRSAPCRGAGRAVAHRARGSDVVPAVGSALTTRHDPVDRDGALHEQHAAAVAPARRLTVVVDVSSEGLDQPPSAGGTIACATASVAVRGAASNRFAVAFTTTTYGPVVRKSMSALRFVFLHAVHTIRRIAFAVAPALPSTRPMSL